METGNRCPVYKVTLTVIYVRTRYRRRSSSITASAVWVWFVKVITRWRQTHQYFLNEKNDARAKLNAEKARRHASPEFIESAT